MQSETSSTRSLVGIDVGGTKCAVSHLRDGKVVEVARFPTARFDNTFRDIVVTVFELLAGKQADFGISCGGPLDAKNGIILCPPNLPESWHGVSICRLLTEQFGGRAHLMNDANACALAEWHFGAGRGTRHMIFLTSGTGMGAGLILNGELYEGATGDAGEIGHVRLRCDGPVGYGKTGSVEGFYSGGGIARRAMTHLSHGGALIPPWYSAQQPLTTQQIAEAAKFGDVIALRIIEEAGTHLGETIAILIDLFNPERIVIGGFFPHCRALLEPTMRIALAREALPNPCAACEILPSQLGEMIGSHGAIAAALYPK
ncbi:MAG: ROK family protein [Opitutaceae bacterium]|nr:ROK family protein [Opitutaceae bacterium]